MADVSRWDWEIGTKAIPFDAWKADLAWVEEPYVSPDGERIAAVVNLDEARFIVCVNGQAWEGVFDKAWYPRFSLDGRRLPATAKHDGHWSLLVDDRLWRQRFDQIRPPVFSPDGRLVAAVVETGGRFGLVVDDRRLPQSSVN
jgi:hypothetical protein